MPETLPRYMRCPRCGAGNPADAAWCGQCLERFEASGRVADDPTSEPGDVSLPATDLRPAMSREGDSLTWTCSACEASNPIESGECARCGTALASLFAAAEPAPAPRTSSGRAVGLSAIMPGLGHWALGRAGAGAARAVLFVWTLGLSVLLLTRPPASGGTIVRAVAVLFLIAAAGVWLVAMLETMRLAEGDDSPVLPRHGLTWLTAGLSFVLVFGLLGSALAARGGQ